MINPYIDVEPVERQDEVPGKYFAPKRISKSHTATTRSPMPNLRIARKRHYIKKQRGIPTSDIPAHIVVAHIEQLATIGITASMIAAAAGCSNSAVTAIANGHRKGVSRDIAARIMSVTHAPHPRQRYCLAIGASRRLRALNAIGWPSKTLAVRLGMTHSNLAKIGVSTRITYARWEQVKQLYDALSGTPYGDKYALRHAHYYKWPSPAAWYGYDIDDPRIAPHSDTPDCVATVDEVLVARIIAGHHTGPIPKLERTAVLNHAVKHHWGATQLAEAFNMTYETADQTLHRHKKKPA